MILIFIFQIFFIQSISQAQSEAYATYGLFPQGATRVTAMGGAYVGLSDDVSGINYNPAGLVQMSYWGDLGGNINAVNNQEADLNGDTIKDGLPYNYLYYAGALKLGRFAFGLGLSSPYISEFEFPLSISGFTDQTRLQLALISFDVPLAYALTDKLSLGFTLHGETLTETYEIKSTTNPGKTPTTIKTELKQSYVSAGVMYQINKEWQVGVAHTPGRRYNVNETLNNQLPSINWFRDAVVPSKTTVGLSYKPNSRWIFVADLDFISKIQNSVFVGSELVTGFQRIEVKDQVQMVPHGGFEWQVYYEKIWDFYLRFGFYNEPARLEGSSARQHTTLGFSVRYWLFVLSVGLDGADQFSNSAAGIGLSLGYYL